MSFTFPKGNFTFDNNKLIIYDREMKEYNLTETSIILNINVLIDVESMMNIVNKISKYIRKIPKDKCASSYLVEENNDTYHTTIINGVAYIENTHIFWNFYKEFEVYLEDWQTYPYSEIYTRDGIDGYLIGYFEFNKYINNTHVIPYESIYYYLLLF